MSNTNSTAASKAAVNFDGGEASPGTITLPASQVAPEIENAHQSRYKKANPLTMSERSALAQVKLAELRAAGLMKTPLLG